MLPPEQCPSCGSEGCIVRFGSYLRKCCIDVDGEVHSLRVKRFKCKSCGVTISYLPSFLVPHKQYMASVIEEHFILIFYCGLSVIHSYKRHLNACKKTLRIWLNQFRSNFIILVQDLLRRTGISPDGCDKASFLFIKLWIEYFNRYGAQIFEYLQVDLCSAFPGIGIFRLLHPAEKAVARGSPQAQVP